MRPKNVSSPEEAVSATARSLFSNEARARFSVASLLLQNAENALAHAADLDAHRAHEGVSQGSERPQQRVSTPQAALPRLRESVA